MNSLPILSLHNYIQRIVSKAKYHPKVIKVCSIMYIEKDTSTRQNVFVSKWLAWIKYNLREDD